MRRYVIPAIAAALLAFLLFTMARASPDVFGTASRGGRWI